MSDGYTVWLDVGGQSERWEQVRVPLSERVPFFDLSPGVREVSLALVPRVLDLPAIIAAGHDPGDALLRVYDGDDLVFAGRCTSSPAWGRRGSAIRLTASESPWADASKIPTAWVQRVTIVDQAVADQVARDPRFWGTPAGYYEREDLRGDPQSPPIVSAAGYELYTQRAEGRAGPLVFGAPGYQDGESWGATPAYWIQTTEGSEELQIARHRVAATTVTIYGPCVDGEIRGKVADVTHVLTTEGVEVAVAEIGPLLGRGPILTVTIGHDPGATYTLVAGIEYRSSGGAISSGEISATWTGGATAADTYAAANAALTAAGLAVPWVSATVEITGPTIVIVYTIQLGRGEYGIPHDVDVTTQTATGAGTLSTGVTNVGVDVALPTDFRPDLSAEWSVAWTGGDALPGGAGDVVRYVLDQTRVRVDRSHLDSWRRELNRYTLAGCVDEEVDAVQWLASQLAWLPIGWVQGRDGLRLWVYDPEAESVATLDEDQGLDVLGDASTTEARPVAQVRVAYRVGEDRPAGRLQTRQQTLWSELARAGEVVELQTDLVDATATAERAAALRQRAYHVRHLLLRGQLRRSEWGWLRAGDPVDVVATSRGVSGRGLVIEVLDDGGPLLQVELLVWRDTEIRRSVFEVQPIPVPVPGPPEHPAYLAHFTTYTTLIPGPVGVQSSGSWSSIYNRTTTPEVEDLLVTAGTVAVDTGYGPDATTEVAVLGGVDELAAWLHNETSVSPDPPQDGPYTLAVGGYAVATVPLENNRSNGQDLINVLRGGRGTGGAAVNAITVETRTTDTLAIRAWSGSGTSDVQTWTGLDSRIQSGTGSKASWLTIGVQWSPDAAPQPWRVVMVADFDDGGGPTVILDDSFTEVVSDLFDADNVTRVRFGASAAGSVFAALALSFTDSTDAFEQAIIAHCYEASRVEITL